MLRSFGFVIRKWAGLGFTIRIINANQHRFGITPTERPLALELGDYCLTPTKVYSLIISITPGSSTG
jgi:hypothetical protein